MARPAEHTISPIEPRGRLARAATGVCRPEVIRLSRPHRMFPVPDLLARNPQAGDAQDPEDRSRRRARTSLSRAAGSCVRGGGTRPIHGGPSVGSRSHKDGTTQVLSKLGPLASTGRLVDEDDPVRNRVTPGGSGTPVTRPVGAAALRRGILVGRYARCDVRTGEDSLALSMCVDFRRLAGLSSHSVEW